MVDMVVHRHKLRATLAELCRLLTKAPAPRRRSRNCRFRRTRERAVMSAAMTPPVDADPRAARRAASQADRSVARPHRAPAGRARSSRAKIAAGDPCRRHQRQGLDHRLHARDPGSRRQARACLYLAASGALQRALSGSAPPAKGGSSPMQELVGHAGGMRARQCRRADHGVRDHDRGGLAAVRAPSGRCAAAGSRPRRAARRDQCDRASARHRDHAHRHRSHRISRRHAREDRRREGRHPQARRAGHRRRAGARRAGRDRAPGRASSARR